MHLLQYVACFCWFSFTVFCVLGLAAQIYKPKRGSRKAENVEYVIVSAANREVREALFESIAHAKHARILVDEGSELIPELDGSSLVVVPSDYRSDLVGKGRAINYFIETEVQRGKWYAFIDDDNLVLDDNFLYEIPYYEERGYVAANPVLVPRNGRSSLAGVMDSIRHFDDLTTFRFFTGLLGKPLAGLHGELLAVKGEVLREIGYNNRSIVEDFRFAQELVRRGVQDVAVQHQSVDQVPQLPRRTAQAERALVQGDTWGPEALPSGDGSRGGREDAALVRGGVRLVGAFAAVVHVLGTLLACGSRRSVLLGDILVRRGEVGKTPFCPVDTSLWRLGGGFRLCGLEAEGI